MKYQDSGSLCSRENKDRRYERRIKQAKEVSQVDNLFRFVLLCIRAVQRNNLADCSDLNFQHRAAKKRKTK